MNQQHLDELTAKIVTQTKRGSRIALFKIGFLYAALTGYVYLMLLGMEALSK